ncbi:MAG: hypothetical protein CM1200mP20_03090 [Pseudomonadota bacterium]|nr:MAG: hypothetical protein CM1200mP20_03090 [Pseudomonadota bacterium]
MQQHMSVAVLCAREILPLLDAMAAGDIEAIRDRRTEMIDWSMNPISSSTRFVAICPDGL